MSSVKDLQVPVYGLFLNMINYIKLTNKIKKIITKQIFDIYIVANIYRTTIYSVSILFYDDS